MTRLQPTCARCIIGVPRNRRYKLCDACKANGYYWCVLGQHVTRTKRRQRNQCRVCKNQYQRQWRERSAIAPPDGYVSLSVAARATHYTAEALRQRVCRGVLPAWRHPVKRGWFVRIEEIQ